MSSRTGFEGLSFLNLLRPETVRRIERWQPFNDPEGEGHLVNPLTILQAISNTDKHRLMVPAVGKIELDHIQIWSDSELTIERAEVVVDHAAHVGSGIPLVRVPCGASFGSAQARLRQVPLPDFRIDTIGMLRIDQVVSLVEQVSDVVEYVGQGFEPAEDTSRGLT